MIKLIAYLSTVIICTLLFIFKSFKPNNSALALKAYTFATVISTVLAVEEVHVWVDNWLGFNNLAWLLSYLVLSGGTYILFRSMWPLFGQQIPTQATLFFIGLLLNFCITYVGYIVHTPEWPNHDYPRSLADLWFMQSMYLGTLYFSLIANGGIRIFWQLSQQEQNQPTRWRLNTLLLYGLLAAFSFSLKSLITSLTFLWGAFPLAELLLKFNYISFGLTSLFWVLALMPRQLFITLINGQRYITQLILFYELKKLANGLGQLVPVRPLNQDVLQVVRGDTLWSKWSLASLEFQAKRLIVGINDARRDFLLQENNQTIYPQLYNLLKTVPDGVSLQESSQIYQQISRQWKGM